MKFLRICAKLLFGLLILAMLTAPIWMIYQLSLKEMENYLPEPEPVLQNVSYGEPKRAMRMDIREYTAVSGTYKSDQYDYMPLEMWYPNEIRWEAHVGDVVEKDQVLGWYWGDPVISAFTGEITNIVTFGDDPHIQYKLLEPLYLECHVPEKVFHILQRSTDLRTEKDQKVEILDVAPVMDQEGNYIVSLSVENSEGTYGLAVKDFRLYTGMVYQQALVLNKRCVYQKTEDGPWFVRRISEDGLADGEVEVGIGFETEDLICVTGIEEGQSFDSGYGAVIRGVIS